MRLLAFRKRLYSVEVEGRKLREKSMKGVKNHEFYLYLFWHCFYDCRFYICMWERTYSFICLEKYAAGGERKNQNCAPLP